MYNNNMNLRSQPYLLQACLDMLLGCSRTSVYIFYFTLPGVIYIFEISIHRFSNNVFFFF
jgi:hypothetical protein